MSFEIKNVVFKFKQANQIAQDYAREAFTRYVEGVEDEYIDIKAEVQYTRGDGYKEYVFAVIELPDVQDNDDDESSIQSWSSD
jgi:hypothetical protein